MFFIENDTYDSLVAALLSLAPCPFTGMVEADAVKLALGEHADIWPARIADDALLADAPLRPQSESVAGDPDGWKGLPL